MDIGLSCTVWAGCKRAGHLDGIGVYTRSLWQAMEDLKQGEAKDITIKPYAFGRNLPELACGVPKTLSEQFRIQALLSGVLNRPLPNSPAIRQDVDIFHASDHQIPNIAGIPVVATVMDAIPLIHPEWMRQNFKSLKSWLFAKSVQKAEHLITISQYSKLDLVEYLGIAPQKISVTPLGVDPVYFERIPLDARDAVLKKYHLDPGFFLFVGTLQPRKNLPTVLKAFNALPDAVRKAHPLIVVGRDGWANESLLPELRKLEDRGEGRWLKYLHQSEVLVLLQSAGALVFASLYEGFGLPVIEAFAAQCPVIASDTTSLPEVTGEAAWRVDPKDVDSIKAAMLNVLGNDALRAERIELGLQRARQYTWQACARQTLAVYQKVLASRDTT
ncbi:alpha-1,3-rhamnosyl/mannosyltransferase [Pseudomonas sp. NFACC02]|uniref:glycosyltransferase family 4 protein n=1 Tax=Pseudomonas sp. NFACC02 TaxID=1566250 RepID=UPI0008C2A9C5|nr:glycosyltransferase family 1 protein [Pseudomonas sp. NFACC02]SER59814.1 alpha-1,3-rhamnosyl/mannosyltransferase [Pseudomonas sp. NFACC02]